MEDRSLAHRQTARDAVADLLRQRILSGDLAPGERLIVPDIAQELGVSQTPAREALQILQSHGLVTVSPYKGARVAELSPDECEEIYLMREVLERLAARAGTHAIGPVQVDELEGLLAEMARAVKAGDMQRFLDADRAFHEVHYRASGRERLWERIITLRYAAERYTRLTYQTLPHELDAAIGNHARLLEYIRSGDEEGSAAWVSETLQRVVEEARGLLADMPDPQAGRGADTASSRH